MATSPTTTVSNLVWLNGKLSDARQTYTSLGGDTAYTWISKFNSIGGLAAAGAAFEPSDQLEYFGIADNEGSNTVTGLIAVNRDDDIVLSWTPEGFVPVPESVNDFQAGTVLELDPETAGALAGWVNEGGSDAEPFNPALNDPTEANLFNMASAEWEEWSVLEDTVSAVVAAANLGPDPLLYTPQERAANADRQQRSGDGKFGGPQVDGDTETLAFFARATLPAGLPLLADPAARIAEYLGQNGDTEPVEDIPVVAAAGPEGSTVPPLYLAVVDPVDNTAVLEVAAVLPDGTGNASAWVRSEGAWVPNNQLVTDLQGATPPPVVELTDEGTIKNVLSQVDSFDASAPDETSEDRANAPLTAASNYALPNGPDSIRTVDDLTQAIQTFGSVKNKAQAKNYIIKSARTLNRTDLIPDDWKQAPELYGEFGEILPVSLIAAGVPGISDTPSDKAATERLMRYWTVGPGAAKIRWGTEGDLTRAHRYLAKYVGSQRAWGLAQNLHKRLFGVPNATKDKLAGH